MLTPMPTPRASTLHIAIVLLATASCGRVDTSTVQSRDVSDARSAVVDLKVGDPAPAFELPGSDGKVYRLADYKGRQAVVLAWFAKAFTTP
jgi:hypothetical protein